jgi:hypothetical protein
MFSLWTNTSYAKLLAIFGLESMDTRMIILREKFKERFKNFTVNGNSFMKDKLTGTLS